MMRIALTMFGLLVAGAASAQTTTSLSPQVYLETPHGVIVLELDAVRAPLTAENFLHYVRAGFYDQTLFHRVIPNFVVQGGGHAINFSEKKTSGLIPNESGNGLSNRRGSVAMAREESPHSAASQFFINLVDNPRLDPLPSRWGYAVFGRVIQGMDVVDRIAHLPTGAGGPFPAEVPLETALIRKAWVMGDPGTPDSSKGSPTPAPPASLEPASNP